MPETPSSSGSCSRAVVLGLGNLLRRDEGLGIRAMEQLMATYQLPPSINCVDGGTLGLDLLCYVEEVEYLLILDAVLTGGPPGTLLRISQNDLPTYFGMRTSPHEIALPDLLAVMRLRGTAPRDLVLWGMQPGTIELGWDLTTVVAANLGTLADAAAGELERWAFPVVKRKNISGSVGRSVGETDVARGA